PRALAALARGSPTGAPPARAWRHRLTCASTARASTTWATPLSVCRHGPEAGGMSPIVAPALAPEPSTRDVEQRLARAARGGDRGAREDLIRAGLRNVVLHALRLGHRGAELDEAVAAGAEGLIRAVDGFDPDRGTRLATYAWPWIARSM